MHLVLEPRSSLYPCNVGLQDLDDLIERRQLIFPLYDSLRGSSRTSNLFYSKWDTAVHDVQQEPR